MKMNPNYNEHHNHLLAQDKFDFINEMPPQIVAEWVAFNEKQLSRFCRDNGYVKWRSKKRADFKALKGSVRNEFMEEI
jgi:hypothetical protein